MHILQCLLAVSCLVEVSFADLRNCSQQHTKPAVCFKNETDYSNPFPTIVDVDVFFMNIVNVDEQMNTISIQMNLWTIWNDSRITLSNGEIEG